jgi:undecaprenyl diphosphate synthase
VQRAITQAIADTADNTGMILTVAFDYGSRAELVRATRLSAQLGEVTETSIESLLYDSEMPRVDVVVRTSGESRISNFLLWQIAGAKVYFTERTWPDFNAQEIDAALKLIHAT